MTKQLVIPFARPPVVRAFLGDHEVWGDGFAGGGGASAGAAAALGREPDFAINHDPEAIAMHKANHPNTKHYIEDVYSVDPVAACGGKPVAFMWFSPDCKHHSKAKGGKPRDAKIRGLAWVAVRWAAAVRPRVICIENVEEFASWGPLDRETGLPIATRKGQTFRAFVRRLEKLGYVVEWRLLRACDFGAPTTRRRLFIVARCDGASISWPSATHGKDKVLAHRPAADCIDWSIPCPSIFEREKPLADNTLARVARGTSTFVLQAAAPFIVMTCGTAAVPYLVHRSNGERVGQAPRIYNVRSPLGTIVAQGQKHALCAAFLAKHYGGHESTRGGTGLHEAMDTVTAQDHHSLVSAFLVRYNGTSGPQRLERPLSTVDTTDRFGLVSTQLQTSELTASQLVRAREVAAFLRRFGHDVGELAIVTIEGEEYVIVDIGMRMLSPRELFRAQGFTDAYIIDPVRPDGRPLTKTAQIRMCGNSVSPVMARAIAGAQFQRSA